MENINSVCYISKIDVIMKIEGADNIEQARIGGWNCIIRKGEYSVGDIVAIATTDAVIPQGLSDAMNVTSYLRKGGRVKTVKLRGVYSECLVIPNQFLPVGYNREGKDLMESLKIFKYEPPVKQIQLASGRKVRYQDNPNFLVYYKFPNMKNVTGMFTEDDDVQITRKIHGTNARYGIVKKTKLSWLDKIKLALAKKIKPQWVWCQYEFVVGSHNVEKGSDSQGFYDTNVWYEIADKYKIKEKLWDYVIKYSGWDSEEWPGAGVVLYGEIYGKGIQKGYDYGIDDIEFVGFDVMENGRYIDTTNAMRLICDILELPHAPILYRGKWSQEVQDKYVFNNFIEMRELTVTDFTAGNMKGIVKTTKVPHEGIVVKHVSGERNKVAKVINPDYLIYGEKHDIGDSH